MMRLATKILAGLGAALTTVVFANLAEAYSLKLHKSSMTKAADLCLSKHKIAISNPMLENMIKGVLEPDALGFSTLQMMKQRVEPGSYGKQRNLTAVRIAAQSFHGSPNPTRPIYTNSKRDRVAFANVVTLPKSRKLADRLDVDIYAYDTNQGVRNKMLLNASQSLCVSLAHKSEALAARKFGNFVHMIGDTYSASHVQRSAPKGRPGTCGTEKIEWHFSMDLVSWKQHLPADQNSADWRYRCLTEHSADLMRQWMKSRAIVKKSQGTKRKMAAANRQVRATLRHLCSRVLRADAHVLRQPAGGAAAGYSSASGVDNWKIFAKKTPDLAILPVGLTGAREANEFYRSVTRALKKAGSSAEFSYPSRSYPDFCKNVLSDQPLKAPLLCTAQEIDWAMKDSEQVRTMWIPARDVH